METSVPELASAIESRLALIVKKTSEFLPDLQKTETFDDVVKSKEPARAMATSVDTHGKVCAFLSEVSLLSIRVRTLRRVLSSSSMAPSLVASYKIRVDRLIADIDDLRQALQVQKDGFESRLRFFNAVLYRS